MRSAKKTIETLTQRLSNLAKAEKEIFELRNQLSEARRRKVIIQEAVIRAKDLNKAFEKKGQIDEELTQAKTEIYDIERDLHAKANEIAKETKNIK